MRRLRIVAFILLGCFSNAAHAACTSPAASAGAVEYFPSDSMFKYCNDTQWIDMGVSPYYTKAVTCNGTTDYLTRGADYTGIADSKQFSGSLWFKKNQQAVLGVISMGNGASYLIQTEVGNRIRVNGKNNADTQIFGMNSSTTITDTDWHHLLFSVDLDIPGSAKMYIDDVDVTVLNTFDAASGDIDFTRTEHTICSDSSGGALFDGSLADLWINFGTYIDFSVEANRRKFIDADGNPVYLGADGSTPTGASPEVFMTGDTATWHTNKGTGGGMTENGALTDAADTPGYNISGLVGYWTLDEMSGTTAADSSGNGNDGAMQGGLNAMNDSTTGQIDNALIFRGVDDFINVGDVLNTLTLPITISAWVYRNSATNAYIVATDDINSIAGNICGAWLAIASNKIATGVGTCTCNHVGCRKIATSTTNVPVGEWVHIVAVYPTFDTRTVYLNGQTLSNTWEGSGTGFAQSTYQLKIGGSMRANTYTDGIIDDVRIYDGALSAGEITNVYCTSTPGRLNYDTANDVMQFCSDKGINTINTNNPGTGGAGCAAGGALSAGTAGTWQYDTANNKMVYCDGTNWRNFGE